MENRTIKGFFEDRPSASDRQPRSHQQAFAKELERINAGMKERAVTVCDILPGGGKSALPQMGTWRIDKGLIDAIVWVVPWKSLKKQACTGFNKNAFNPVYDAIDRENASPLIPASDFNPRNSKRSNPVRVVVASYAGIAHNTELYTDFMRKYRCDIYLDEVHHLCEDELSKEDAKNWNSAINRLAPLAEHVFAMGGTLDNGQVIPFVNYETVNEKTKHVADINYGFGQALTEKAIIQIDPMRVDGYADYSHKGKKYQAVALKDAKNIQESKRALRTCIGTGSYDEKMLNAEATSFLQHQKTLERFDHSSKMLVVAPDTGSADAYKSYLEERFGREMRIAVAHTNGKSGDKPHQTIEDFKKSDGYPHARDRKQYECLVTVGMAYEGLDVPDLSHLVALTFIRSKSWITQMIARCWRVDYEGVKKGYTWAMQRAFLFVPDDHGMNKILDKLYQEQKDSLREKAIDIDVPPIEGPTPPTPPSTFVPHDSDLGEIAYATKAGEKLSDIDSYWISQLLAARPRYASFPPYELIEMRDSGEIPFTPSNPFTEEKESEPLDHASLRRECQDLAARIDIILIDQDPNSYHHGYANRQAVKRFKMKREQMGIEDLIECRDWLNAWLGSIDEIAAA